ncbi:MAG: hypothetical protein QFX34_03560 [Candidatus Verstraetearchaeota archaeon]|nr:hypothetical protein [Candidatus Verstraetearchaeota archaeon]
MKSWKLPASIIALAAITLIAVYIYTSLPPPSGGDTNDNSSNGVLGLNLSVISFSPGNSSMLNSNQVMIYFLLNDTSINPSDVSILLNGTPVAFQSSVEDGSKRFFYSAVLPEGQQRSTLQVRSGNATILQESITFWVDVTPPRIYGVSPENQSVAGPMVRVSASIFDNIKLQASSISLKIDSTRIRNFVYSSGKIYYDARLSDGNHTVMLSVRDAAGNTAERTWGFVVGQAAEVPGVIVTAKTGYINENGLPVIVGEVKNNGNTTVRAVLINGSFLCSEGNVINNDKPQPATILQYAEIQILLPGEVSPFKIVMPKTFPDFVYILKNVRKFNASVVNYTATSSVPHRAFETTGTGAVNKDGYYCLNAEVINTGNTEAHNVKVVATFYSADLVFDVQVAYIPALAPGESASTVFTIPDKQVSSKITSFDMKVIA